eukprot:7684012-Karenia_brevis.AAC.1
MPEGAKEWAAELQGKSDEEKKQFIEDTLKEANERVEAKKNADTKSTAPLIDGAELTRRIAVLAKDPN